MPDTTSARTKIVMDPIPRYGSWRTAQGAVRKAHHSGHESGYLRLLTEFPLEAQEAYAAASLAKARASTLEEELVPVEVRVKKNRESVTADELYCKPEVTAGAADAAAMCVLIGETAAQRLQTSVISRAGICWPICGLSRRRRHGGCSRCTESADKRQGRLQIEIDLIAVNEATAAQALSVIAALGLSAGEAEKKRSIPYGGCAGVRKSVGCRRLCGAAQAALRAQGPRISSGVLWYAAARAARRWLRLLKCASY